MPNNEDKSFVISGEIRSVVYNKSSLNITKRSSSNGYVGYYALNTVEQSHSGVPLRVPASLVGEDIVLPKIPPAILYFH